MRRSRRSTFHRIRSIQYAMQQAFHQYRTTASEQHRENEKVVNDLNESQQPTDGTMVIASSKVAALLEGRQ